MNKKLTVLTLLTLIFLTLFSSATVNAAGLNNKPSRVIVCGRELTQDSESYLPGCRYESESATLYLNNARLTSAFTLTKTKNSAFSGKNVCVYADGSLNIVLEGGNSTIGSSAVGNNECAVFIDNGSLRLTSQDEKATLSLFADATSKESIAVYTSCYQTGELCTLSVDNISLTVTSGFACLYSSGDVSVNESSVSAKSANGFCIGANCGSVELTDSRFTLHAKTYAVYSGNGCNENSFLKISGCDIDAVSVGNEAYINLIEALGDISFNESRLKLNLTGNKEGSAVYSYNGHISFTDTSFDAQSCGYGILAACGNVNFAGSTNGKLKTYSYAAYAGAAIGFDLNKKGSVSAKTEENVAPAFLAKDSIDLGNETESAVVSLPKQGKAEKIGSAWYITDKNGSAANSVNVGRAGIVFSAAETLLLFALTAIILAVLFWAVKTKKNAAPRRNRTKRYRAKAAVK